MASEASSIPLPLESPQSQAARGALLTLVLFSIGHCFVDLYSSALGAFQPVIGEKLGLTLTQAGLLGGLMVFASSVVQPAYGYLSDRFHSRLFSALGPAVAGIFISSLGMAPSFAWLTVLVLLGGTGIASFHPQASSRAAAGFTGHRGRWMAIFISAGSVGLAFGPTYFSMLFAKVGPARAWWGAAPGVGATILLLCCMPHATAAVKRRKPRLLDSLTALRPVWRPLTVLYLLVFIRSILQIVYTQLLPLYLHRERGYSVAMASLALSLYLAAGAIGGFVGGPLADRFGGKRVICVSMAGCLPLLFVFFAASGTTAIVALALGGLVLLFTNPVNIVMAQELAPAQIGTVSALMQGFAWGLAGLIFIPLTGWAGDIFSLHHALMSLLVFPVIGIFLTLKLPE
jgi:FSR family fosmidomycin resistance protein-like MFS transporter